MYYIITILVLLFLKLVIEVRKRLKLTHPYIIHKKVKLVSFREMISREGITILQQETEIYEKLRQDLMEHKTELNEFLNEEVACTTAFRQYQVSIRVDNPKMKMKEIRDETLDYLSLTWKRIVAWWKTTNGYHIFSKENKSESK